MTRSEAIKAVAKLFKDRHENDIKYAQTRLKGAATVASKLTDADHEQAAIAAIDSAIYTAAVITIMQSDH